MSGPKPLKGVSGPKTLVVRNVFFRSILARFESVQTQQQLAAVMRMLSAHLAECAVELELAVGSVVVDGDSARLGVHVDGAHLLLLGPAFAPHRWSQPQKRTHVALQLLHTQADSAIKLSAHATPSSQVAWRIVDHTE